jgi:O-antigen/teichoic acid export membrane protein
MGLGLSVRFILQFFYFVIIARTLKPEEYGVFAGTLPLVLLLAPFATWGSGIILIQQAARDPAQFSNYWGRGISITLMFGLILTGIACLLGVLLLPPEQPITIILFLAIGDLLGFRFNEISAQAFQALQRLGYTSFLYALLSVLRFVFAILFYLTPVEKTAVSWSLLHMISGLLGGLVGLWLVSWKLGKPLLRMTAPLWEWRDGFYYSISTFSQSTSNDIDKTLLLRMSGGNIAGFYAAAYRFVDAMFLPIVSLLQASFPRFFQHGVKGIQSSLSLAYRLLPWTTGMGVIAAIGLILAGHFIPFILGADYRAVTQILPWLAPIIIFRVYHYMAANSLTGAGFQGARSAVQVGAAILNLGLNLWLIPQWSWRGAALSSLITDGMLAAVMWSIALTKKFRATLVKKV